MSKNNSILNFSMQVIVTHDMSWTLSLVVFMATAKSDQGKLVIAHTVYAYIIDNSNKFSYIDKHLKFL